VIPFDSYPLPGGSRKKPHKSGNSVTRVCFNELWSALNDSAFKELLTQMFRIDPGHVRRKFYELAVSCGFSQAPDAIRKPE
jgi:hypothetical protein